MRAAIFEGPGKPLRIAAIPDPAPEASEIVLRVRSCGICGSDLHMTSGHGVTFPDGTVLGHEFAGEVVALGAGAEGLTIGDRVAVMPVKSCGICPACRSGRPVKCSRWTVVGCGEVPGGYAEYARAPVAGCLRLPDNITFDDGALLEPLAVARRGVRLVDLDRTGRALVMGIGPIGLGALYWIERLGGKRLAAMATSRRRASLASTMGAGSLVLLEDGMEAVRDALGGAPDLVVECTGQPGMIAKAIEAVADSGTVIVLGTCSVPDTFLPVAALAKEVSVRFSFLYELADYRQALETMAAGNVAPRAMITGHIGFDALSETFEALRGRTNHCKVMIDPTEA